MDEDWMQRCTDRLTYCGFVSVSRSGRDVIDIFSDDLLEIPIKHNLEDIDG